MLCLDVTQLPMIVCLESVADWTLAQRIQPSDKVIGGEVKMILL